MNALYEALLALWEGREPNYSLVLGTEGGSEGAVRELVSSLWVKCYNEGKRRICVYSYKRIPKHPIPLLLDARGTVISWDKDGPHLLAYPFHKFFNVGEIDYPNGTPLYAFEKLDGTMISVFWDGERLRAATRKRMDIDSPFASKALEMLDNFDPKGHTYVFELLGPGCGSPWVGVREEVDELLIKEGGWRLVPLAKRNMNDLKLFPLPGPRSFRVRDWGEAKEIAEREGIEGMVLWYEEGTVRPKMYKVKSKRYSNLIELLNQGYSGLARIILKGKLDDIARFLDKRVYEKAKLIEEKLDEITKATISGFIEDEDVKEWLSIDPERAVEEVVKKCLRENCRELLS
ncbi:hypothetical protein IPA_00460 [Ignicoccus pacificus DSM 13166]|uniref:RNA ligase n=1 Tax=Ignicoccus pacificus DSM 13166 TaxID=940294 RepID=A0A977KAB9_9CREN|nr:hypothetical protein IPA_00460 [Ignicoccus pacificus DSM 13166]